MSRKQPEYRTEVYTVEILRRVETGVAESEMWKNKDGEIHRPLKDGPAIVCREPYTGRVVAEGSNYWLRNRIVNESTGCPIRPLHPKQVHKARSVKFG